MATIKPFCALRPKPDLAAQICELPYDVMSSAEARQMASGNPLSFLHVSKPEIDLPEQIDPCDPRVYAKGKENFVRLVGEAMTLAGQPMFYLYRQVMGAHAQVGLVAVASCEEYKAGLIKKHELTRPDKEDDRVRHLESLNAQTGPVFLLYKADPFLDELFSKIAQGQPDVDFTAADGIRHTSWLITDRTPGLASESKSNPIQLITERFAQMPSLYIADGHHRCAAAARVCSTRSSETGQTHNPVWNAQGDSSYFLSVIFPHNQLQILPYNRVLKDLNGLTPDELLAKLDGVFIIQLPGRPSPARKHELGFYLNGKWHTLNFRPHFAATKDPFEKLDVTLLQKYVLEPLFGIEDPRTSQRLNFVGGIRGTAELEKLVNRGEYACAFSLHPTGVEDLMAVADQGGIMPPKSTWFEPKLRDGMFCHLL